MTLSVPQKIIGCPKCKKFISTRANKVVRCPFCNKSIRLDGKVKPRVFGYGKEQALLHYFYNEITTPGTDLNKKVLK